MPGKTKMKTAARLPSMLITALMSGISMARIMVRRNQVVAITARLVFSHLNALSSLNTRSFSKESRPSLNRGKYLQEIQERAQTCHKRVIWDRWCRSWQPWQ